MISFPLLLLVARNWWKWEEHFHQTDEDHPRPWILWGGQERLHRTDLWEHIHSNADHDPSHEHITDLLQVYAQPGRPDSFFFLSFFLLRFIVASVRQSEKRGCTPHRFRELFARFAYRACKRRITVCSTPRKSTSGNFQQCLDLQCCCQRILSACRAGCLSDERMVEHGRPAKGRQFPINPTGICTCHADDRSTLVS